MQDTTFVVNRMPALDPAAEPVVSGQTSSVELAASMGDTGALRGLTDAAADVAECTCPEPCERDHANE